MSKINLEDNFFDVGIKLSNGNPGAIAAIAEIANNGAKIDPDDFMGGISPLLQLDDMEIYGTDIYVLYSDICDKDITKMLAVLRAVQLGYFSREVFKRCLF
jgi:hypothetical protein